MTLEKIKQAIEQLPADQQKVLTGWLKERDWEAWDAEIERDFSADGRGISLLMELESQLAEGKTEAMEEGFAHRRKSSQ